jgi:serine/threonine-protein kinase
VYRAWDIVTRRDCALKTTRNPSPDYTRRILRNAELVSSVAHPNVARVLDWGTVRDATAYVASEWVPGSSLHDYARTHRLELDQVLLVGAGVSRALHAVHTAGRLHRDVKAANVIIPIDPDGAQHLDRAVLVDFGLARPLRHLSPTGEARTGLGMATGTLSHMSPEQLAGRRSGVQSDLYSLGIMLYHLIFGQYPHVELSCGIVSLAEPDFPRVFLGPFVLARLTSDVSVPAEPPLPTSVRDLLARLLRRDPAERIPTASITGAALEEITLHEQFVAQ